MSTKRTNFQSRSRDKLELCWSVAERQQTGHLAVDRQLMHLATVPLYYSQLSAELNIR